MGYTGLIRMGNIIFFIMLGISFIFLSYKLIYFFMAFKSSRKLPEAKKKHKFALLIPARNESKVIGNLLESIQNQTYDKELLHTYVIVESEDDPTCEIVKKYPRTEVVVRQRLDLKGKGYALDEAFQKILPEKKGFDAYFIIDADNFLTPNFVEEMNKSYDAGYKVATGYRNSKNWNGGWIASCSALVFSMINTFQNKTRTRFNFNILVSGTGFYVSHDIIEKLGGWKFYTLTEDAEFSLYSCLNNVKSMYNEYAEFYDEQPTDFKTSWKQRLRWTKGHSQAHKIYGRKILKSAFTNKENRLSKLEVGMSILPLVSIVATLAVYSVYNFTLTIIGLAQSNPLWWIPLVLGLSTILLFYLSLSFYTIFQLIAERKHSDITLKNSLICVLTAPFYICLFGPIFFQSLFKKEVAWTPIKHEVTISLKD